MRKTFGSVACVVALGTFVLGTVTGCGGDEQRACTLGESEGCEGGQVCEEVLGGEPACFAPVVVEGRVFDALTPTLGIVGATVVAIDANGAARSTVVLSGVDGAYSLAVPAPRDANGVAMSAQITLRADAAGYQTFPTAPRTGIPVELSGATDVDGDGDDEISNAATNIALIPREDLGSGRAIVRGRIDHADGGGALVVASQGDTAVSTAISALDGTFILFDVPTSTTTIGAYRAGLNVTPQDVSVLAPETIDVVLAANVDGLATVTGSVQIVNAPGGSVTSVILVLESTFVENVARGEAPPGLRAAPVSGGFTIEGVGPGNYVALAAFENDGLVRDPDTSIGGTEIVHLTVPAGGGTIDLSEGFKVTGALEVISPGAEVIEVVTDATPTFTWADDSSEDGYEVRVFDAFGNMVGEDTMVPRVTGSSNVSYDWTPATPLEAGMIYQFRAWSFSDGATGHVLISATEDLRGVFVYQP